MSVPPGMDETNSGSSVLVGTQGRHGGVRDSPGGDGTAPDAPTDSAKRRRSRVVAGLLAVLVLLACGIGVAIGYAVNGTSPTAVTPPTSPPTTGGSSNGGTSGTSAVTAEIAPELVNIYATFAYETAQGAGTGMVVSSSGRVITNNHVIAGATAVKATDLGNGKTYAASVVGYDVADDVAVLQLQGASGLQTVSFARSSARIGDAVIAIGNAGGKGAPTAAAGVVTGLDKAITAQSELSGTTEHLSGLIETDAAIESGQSGGPLVNTGARVLGMVTAGSSNFAFSQGASQGYAVPAATFRSIAADIADGKESGSVHIGATAFLGVRVTSVEQAGAFVVQVLATSPAAVAGVAPGDLITEMAGRPVRAPETLSSVLAAYHPGATVQAGIVDQSGVLRAVTMTLVAGPPA